MENKKIKTVALFSGGGGLDLGFSAVGYKIVFSSDIDQYSCNSLIKNQGKKPYLENHKVLCADIRSLTGKQILEETGDKVDFVIGGPPCQAFSVFGKRKGLGDPRGNLVYEYIRIIKELSPRGFLFENVAGLKTIHGGELYAELLDALSIDGKYAVSAHEYEVADFGIPQFRRRVFLIGSDSGKTVPQMEPTHTSPHAIFNAHRPYNTVSKILKDLPQPITSWRGEAWINGHVGRKHSDRIIERYESLKHGERDHKTRINKLDPERPSFTIIVGSDQGGGKGHVHPFDPREVTPRESARIQTFPDWWEFDGTGRHIIRQVGNAVPPVFGAVIASHVAKHMFGVKKSLGFDALLEKMDLPYLRNDS